jgi:hypothetical protein
MALVNQEAAANGQPPVGFLNPALYALGQSADYTNNLNDITVGNNATAASGGLFPAVPGYDLCTGWGSPKGSNLIHSLAVPQRLVIAPNSALLFAGPVGGPLNPSALTYSLTNRTGSLDWSLALDVAWLTASPTNNGTLRSSPRRVRRSWVRVPPVELGGSRRNGQVPVQPQGWRGLSSPGKEPTGRNEDEPHRMSPVMLNERRRRASGALCEGRCSQESQSPCPANSVGVSVVSTSGRHASDKRGGPGR